MPARVACPRRAVTVKLPPALIVAWGERAALLGVSKTAVLERALEAALRGDTQVASAGPVARGGRAAGRGGRRHTEEDASPTGAVTARGASGSAAPPRAPVNRADAFRAAAARRAGK